MKSNKLLIFFFLIIFNSDKSIADKIQNLLKEGGKLVMIRHAHAPGNGDPENFLIKDCSTQRNLNKSGIQQSKMIGNFFKENRIPIGIILSSEWCRCKQTAKYAFNNYETNSFLNSFYDIKFQNNKDKQIKDLKNYLMKWNGKKNLILITHYVVINELLNVSANSGEIIISDLKFNVIGRIENMLY